MRGKCCALSRCILNVFWILYSLCTAACVWWNALLNNIRKAYAVFSGHYFLKVFCSCHMFDIGHKIWDISVSRRMYLGFIAGLTIIIQPNDIWTTAFSKTSKESHVCLAFGGKMYDSSHAPTRWLSECSNYGSPGTAVMGDSGDSLDKDSGQLPNYSKLVWPQ